MTAIQHINPEGLFTSPAFSQAVAVPPGATLVFVGGQNGVDATGQLVGDDIASQTIQAVTNVRTTLEAAGAGFADVVSWTTVLIDPSDLQEGFAAFLKVWDASVTPPAITAQIVTALGVPGARVEISAVAATYPT